MYKTYSLEPVSYSYEDISNIYYKVILRNNISQKDNFYTANEYTIVLIKNDSDIDEYIKENFDILLEQARINEKESNLNKKVENLKKKLDNSDYQILKCSENFMIGNVLPYDFSKLLSNRIGIRDEINKIQNNELTTEATLEEEKQRKIIEMMSYSQTTITNGIDYNGKHYRLNTTDQINLTTLGSLAAQGQSVPYHADGEICSIYTAEEMNGLIAAASKFIIYHTTYFNLLKHQILDLETIEEVKAVYYGIELKDKYKDVIIAISGA
jgi:hypothetical protein